MKIVRIASFFIVIGFIGASLYSYVRAQNEATESQEINQAKHYTTYVIDVPIKGKAAILYDISEDKILYGKNITTEYPLASITKIMTAIVAREHVPENTEIRISGDGSETAWRRDDLLSLLLVTSSNQAAEEMRARFETEQDASFVDAMNEKAQEIGMEQAYFLNETGLDITGAIGGSYGSPLDVVKMLRYALRHHNDLFQNTKHTEITLFDADGISHQAINTNTFVEYFPSLVISKTGLTDLAGGNLAVIFEKEPGHFIAGVVLGSTEEERFTDLEKLTWATFGNYYGRN